METREAAIPDDPALMRQMILDLLRENDLLHRELHGLRHMLFEPSSEKSDQLTFPFTTQAFPAELPPPPPDPKPGDGDKRGHGRRRIPPQIPRVTTVCDVSDAEKRCACGKERVKIGEEVTEQVDFIPASLQATQVVRPKYACPEGHGPVVIAPLPPQVIERGLPGPSLLAHVIVSKYADHLPLNRQQEIFARHGFKIARSTQCDWIARAAELLAPIADEIHRDVLDSKLVHTDDTPVRNLARRDPLNGRLWDYVGDARHRQTSYKFSATHERRHPVGHLEGYQSYLQADAYKGYDALYAGGRIVEVACWAHTRRYFFEAQVADATRSQQAMAFIQRLYRVEHDARGKSAEERRAMRQERSKPIVEAFGRWMSEQTVLPKSAIGEAIAYATRQWAALNRYLEDGDLSIDNTAAERALRRIAVGRNNWLFFASDSGGERAAILYTLIGSCRDNRIDPFAYLRDVLVRIATTPARDIAQLMPRLWKPAAP